MYISSTYQVLKLYPIFFSALIVLLTVLFQQVTEDRESPTDTSVNSDLPHTSIQVGDLVYKKAIKRSWAQPIWEGPFKVIQATDHAVKVSEQKVWIHKTHLKAVGNQDRSIEQIRADLDQLNYKEAEQYRHILIHWEEDFDIHGQS